MILPAAASQTEMNMAVSWHNLKVGGKVGGQSGELSCYLMEVESFNTLRYCRMSGIDIKRRTRRNLRPIHVRSRKMLTNIGGMVK